MTDMIPQEAPDPSTGLPVTGQPSAQPDPSQAQAQPQAQPAAPQQAQPQGQQPAMTHAPADANPSSSLHARLFDGILKTLSGGPVKVMQTDPTTGATRQVEVPESRGQMGKSILAAVLSGMFAGGDRTSPGAGGAPRNDPGKSAAIGFQAGQDTINKIHSAPQNLEDEKQARQLTTVGNNIKLAQQTSAMALQQHKVLGDVITNNQNTILADAKEWDEQRDGNDPSTKAILGQNLTLDQAMNALKGNMTSQNAFVDGTVSVRNPQTGVMEEHPTYSILNPDVKIKLSQKTTDTLAKYNKQYQDAYEVTGGNVSVPLRVAIGAMHEANTLTSAQDFFNRANETLHPLQNGDDKKPEPIDLAAAVKKDRTLLPAIDQAEKAMAAGGNMANVMDAVRNSPQGAKLMSVLGVTPETVDQYIRDQRNEATEEESVAKTGGKIALENAKQAKADAIITETATNILKDPKNMASIEKLASLRNDSRQKLFNELTKQSGGTFNIKDAETKAKTYSSFNEADGKDRQQIESYGTFLKHDSNLVNVLKKFIRPDYTPKWIDQPLNWIEKNVTSDPEMAEFMARIVPVKSEFINFMKNNHAALQEDAEEMNKVVDGSQSPRYMLRTAQTLGETGLDRLDSKNSTYKQTFGENYPNLFDERAKAAAVNLGLGDRLKEYGINPPAAQQTPDQKQATAAATDKKQQVLQSLKQPNGQPYKDVKFGPNGSMVVWDGVNGHGWINPLASKQ